MADEKLKGTHIRLTAYHLTKAREANKAKTIRGKFSILFF